MKRKSIWFERRFIGFVPIHPKRLLLLLFTVFGILGLVSAAGWLTRHHYDTPYADLCYLGIFVVALVFLALFFRHVDLK